MNSYTANPGSVAETIESKIRAELAPAELVVENESHRHAGPATESHFKVTVVTELFADMPRVKRHQRLYSLLAAELQSGVHALALHLYTPAEWAQRNQAPDSPDCRGGSKGRD